MAKPSKYDSLIQQSAQKAGIDPALFRAQLVQESGLNPEAVSKVGALGIAQIMPKYWLGKYGLETIDDIKNPEKAIPASAQIMADFSKQYGGWNQALVAYNAGPGKKNKYVNAMAAGNLELLPKETQDYVRKLGTGVNAALPQPGVLSASAPAPDGTMKAGNIQFGQQASWASPEESLWDSFRSGVRGSAIGTALRREDSLKSLLPTSYQFSDADLEAIRNADIGEAGTRFVMRNSHESKDVQELIRIARENREAASKERTLMGDLAYGTGEMAGDPVTYGSLLVPGGIYMKGSQLFSAGAARVAAGTAAVAMEGALSNVVSESLREGTTGTDADYMNALAAGAVGSVAIAGATRAAGKAFDSVSRGISRVEANQTTMALNKAGLADAKDISRLSPMDIDEVTGQSWRQILPEQGERPLLFQDEPHAGFGRTPEAVLLQSPNGDVIHPATGHQYSSHNPLNPAHSEPVELNLKGVAGMESADVLATSQNDMFKAMAFNLVRSTRGYADGSAGKVGITSQDVDKAMKGEHFNFQFQFDDLRARGIQDPFYEGLSSTDKRRVFNERTMRAVEDGVMDHLSPVERQAVELRRKRYEYLAEQQVSPGARWGVEAQPLLDEASVKQNYQPVVYNDVRLNALKDSLGNDAVQDLIARSFYGSYLARTEVRKRVDDYLAQLTEKLTPEEYAQRVAFGIVSNGEGLGMSHLLANMAGSGSFGAQPNFRKMRSPLDYDWEIDLPNGEKFSVNDVRSWDADTIDSAYFNRVKGDISVAVGTGMTPDEFQGWMNVARLETASDKNLRKEMIAMEKIAGALYGQGVRNGGERLAATQAVFQNLAFMKSSAYMGLMNYGEIASGIQKNGLGFVLRSLPVVNKAFRDLRFGKQTAEAMRTAQNAVWGPAIDRAIHPTFREAIDRRTMALTRDSGNNAVNSVLGAVAGVTDAAAARFWTSRVLEATNRHIVEAARGEFFADLAAAAHGVRKTNFTNQKKFREASVSKPQMDAALELLRETTSIDAKGNLSVTNPVALSQDPRAAALRRYGQFWSERVIQQNNIGSSFRWSHLPLVGMFTQFMSFVTRSVNAKLIRGNSDILKNGNLDEAISMYMIAPLLSALTYTGTTYLQSTKFTSEGDRKKFLKERLGDDDDLGPTIAGGIKRMPAMGGPSWLYDTIGTTKFGQAMAPEFFKYAGFGKTSTEAKLRKDAQQAAGPIGSYLGDAVENAPAVKIADSFLSLAATPAKKVMAGDDSMEQERIAKATMRAWQGLLPNDPMTQRAFQEFIRND